MDFFWSPNKHRGTWVGVPVVQGHIMLSTARVQLTQYLLTVRAKAAVVSHWSRAMGTGEGEAWPYHLNRERMFLIGSIHFLFI